MIIKEEKTIRNGLLFRKYGFSLYFLLSFLIVLLHTDCMEAEFTHQ